MNESPVQGGRIRVEQHGARQTTRQTKKDDVRSEVGPQEVQRDHGSPWDQSQQGSPLQKSRSTGKEQNRPCTYSVRAKVVKADVDAKVF